MTTENNQELNQLEAEAAAIDAAAEPQAPETETQTIPLSNNQAFKPSIIQFLNFLAGTVSTKIPQVREYFNDLANEGIADAVINVAEKEGIDLQDMFGDPNSRWGAWLGLLMAVGIPSFGLYMALQAAKAKPVEASPGETKTDKKEEFSRVPVVDISKGFHA